MAKVKIVISDKGTRVNLKLDSVPGFDESKLSNAHYIALKAFERALEVANKMAEDAGDE